MSNDISVNIAMSRAPCNWPSNPRYQRQWIRVLKSVLLDRAYNWLLLALRSWTCRKATLPPLR